MKKVRLKLLAIAFVLPMLFVSCSEDEPVPTPPGAETPDVPTSTPESPVKPIVFETKSMYWQTEYKADSNIYQTLCADCEGGHDIVYAYMKDVDNPQKITVTKFTVELGDDIKEVDISEITRQASESPNGYFNVTLEGVTLKYEKYGEFVVSYGEDIDQTIYASGKDNQYYNISLEGDESYSTELRIEDKLFELSGLYSMSFDLSEIEYPTYQDYDFNGAKNGLNYYVYLPANACDFPIVCKNNNIGKHLYFTSLSQKNDDDSYSELSVDLVEEEKVDGGWFYVKESSVGKFSHKELYSLKCEIPANTTGKERTLRLILTCEPEGKPIDPLIPTNFHIIQSAE